MYTCKRYDIHEYLKKETEFGEANMKQIEKMVCLRVLDYLWTEHLENMDYLIDSVRLRAYGQKDPLIEYKQEGYEMFLEMMIDIRRNVVYSLFQFQPQGQPQTV